jgi:hypothetical protein
MHSLARWKTRFAGLLFIVHNRVDRCHLRRHFIPRGSPVYALPARIDDPGSS